MQSHERHLATGRRALLPAVLVAVSALGLLAVQGCVQRTCDLDGNGEYTKAMRASPSILVKDNVGERCDTVDWRFVSDFQDANATLVFRVGDPFKGHKMEGSIALYDVDAQLLDQTPIRPNESKYEFRFPVKARKQYFVKIESTNGNAEYTLETKFEPIDPCAKCNPEQDCIQGKCVAKVEVKTEASCKGVCPEGFLCDEVANKCIRVPCGGPCPSGQECDEERDQCRKAWKPECRKDKDCKGDKVCSKGRCRSKETGPREPQDPTVIVIHEGPEKLEPITASITQAVPSGNGLLLIISKGTAEGVKAGASGSINGLGGAGSFQIKEANAHRSKAIVKISKDQLGNNKRVTIKR